VTTSAPSTAGEKSDDRREWLGERATAEQDRLERLDRYRGRSDTGDEQNPNTATASAATARRPSR
jgi:hypothetical protein